MTIDKRSMGTPYWFPVGGDALVVLGDDAGVKKFIVQDVNQVDVGYIDSLGNLWLAGSATVGSIIYDPSIPIVNPPAGKFLLYVDSDGIMHIIDESGNEVTYNFSETVEGSGGAVAVYEDVQSSLLYNQLFGHPFRNDILKGGATYISISGDIFLYRINTAGVITYEVYTSATDGALAPTANTESVFDMTVLGVYNADQVLAMAGLGVAVTTSTRIDALSQADADTVMPTLQPDYVNGYSPSEVHEVVNRGGNYHFSQDINDAGYQLTSITVLGTHTWESSVVSNQLIAPEYPCVEGEVYSCSLRVVDLEDSQTLSTLQMRFYSGAGSLLSFPAKAGPLGVGTHKVENQTAPSGAKYIRITPKNTLADKYITTDQFQINAGSTALDYSPPLNSPFIAGSLSENQLENGNNELALTKWLPSNSGSVLSHDETDFLVTNDGTVYAGIYQDVQGDYSLLATIRKGTANAIIQVFTEEESPSNAELIADGWTWTVGSLKYEKTVSTTTATDVGGYFGNVTKVVFTNGVNTDTFNSKFREVQLIKGSYTLAELQAKGYVSYAPLLLHNTGDGTDNKSDRLYQVGSDVMLEQNNEVHADYELGDDLFEASVITGDDSDFDTDTGFWTKDTGVTIPGTGLAVFTAVANNAALIRASLVDIGRGYIAKVTVSNYVVGSVAFQVGTGGLSPDMSANGDYYFIIIGGASTTFQFKATVAGTTLDITDLLLYPMNVWQSSSPETINATEKGWALTALNQPADNGQNHQIFDGNMISTTKHLLGLGAALKNLTDVVQTKADISAIPYIGRCAVTNAGDLAANSETYYSYSDMPNFRDFVNNIAEIYKYSMNVGVNYVDFYPNGAVVSTGGSIVSAGTLLFDYVVGEMVDVSSEVL